MKARPEPPYLRRGDGNWRPAPRALRLKRLARRRIANGGDPVKVVACLLCEYDDPEAGLWASFLLTELREETSWHVR